MVLNCLQCTILLPLFQLLEIRAQGRFGCVWKGQISSSSSDSSADSNSKGFVAVKVFPLAERQSWAAEQEIYRLPRMSHENVLKFIGVDKRGEGLEKDFWLLTEFHERGE